jgi:hypothetical protein
MKAERQKGINPSGDCGPCCLAGVTGVSVDQIYKDFGRIDGMTYDCMYQMSWRYAVNGLLRCVSNDLPSLDSSAENPRWMTFGRPSWFNEYGWISNVSAKIIGGWIGIAMVNLWGKALEEEHANHWVLVVGCNNSESFKDRTVDISCPTRGEFTIQSKDFLKNYGGYNVIWVKPLAIP